MYMRKTSTQLRSGFPLYTSANIKILQNPLRKLHTANIIYTRNYKMTEKDIINGIIKSLEEIFVYIDINEFEIVDLSNFIEDSLQFMSFIVRLEDNFSIEFPPELMIFDNFKSINNINKMVSELIVLKEQTSLEKT